MTQLPTYQAPDEHFDDVDARAEMVRLFGEERGTEFIRAAQQTVKALGPAVADWLTETNLGNDVGVLVALSQADFLMRSPDAARKELEATMKTEGFLKGNKMLVLKVAALSRIANRETVTQQAPKMEGLLNRQPAGTQEAALRAEAAKLASKKQMSREDAARFQQITSQLAGR
jgi:hypothetical protein